MNNHMNYSLAIPIEIDKLNTDFLQAPSKFYSEKNKFNIILSRFYINC